MYAIRRATREEDHRGIDAVVSSDVGNLYIQIKSSRAGRARFESRRRRSPVGVVIVRSGESPEGIREKVVATALHLRKRFLEERLAGGRGGNGGDVVKGRRE